MVGSETLKKLQISSRDLGHKAVAVYIGALDTTSALLSDVPVSGQGADLNVFNGIGATSAWRGAVSDKYANPVYGDVYSFIAASDRRTALTALDGTPDFSAGGTALTRYGAGYADAGADLLFAAQFGDNQAIGALTADIRLKPDSYALNTTGALLRGVPAAAFELRDNLSQMLYVIDGDSKDVVITDAWIRSSGTQLTQDAGEDLLDGFAFGEQRILAQYQGSASTGQDVFFPLQRLYASDLPLLHVRRLLDLNKEAKLQLGLRDINTRDASQVANLSSSQGLYVSAFPQLQAIAPDGAIIAQLFRDRDISDAGDDVTFNAALASAQWSGDQIFGFTNEATGGKVTSPADLIGFNAFMRAEPLYVVSAGTEVLFYQRKLFLQDN